MTVSGFAGTEYRPFDGFRDPALPIASYISQAGITGDASGGSVLLDNLFQIQETGRGTPNFFNLEQVSVDISSSVASGPIMRTLNMGRLAPTRAMSPLKWQLFVTPDGVDDAALQLNFLAGLPLWLDAPTFLVGDAGLRFEFANQDLILFATTVQGYVWSPRSVRVDGGPQRPIGGMFR